MTSSLLRVKIFLMFPTVVYDIGPTLPHNGCESDLF